MAALKYAAMGWEVFPAPPGQKKSHKSQEHSGAKWGKTTDPELIRADFRKWPNANVAIVTGAESGIFVVEADTVVGHGVDGLASIQALEAEHGPLPETRMAVSPSGSIHRYFLHPGAGIYIKNSTSELASGVDVRGDGGMVIAPPSIKPDIGEYRWENDVPIAHAPGWLIERVSKKEVKKPPARAPKAAPSQANFQRQDEAQVAGDLGEIEAAIMAIPNHAGVNWQEWNRIAMAIFAATGGSAAGFAMFDRWSQKYPGYDFDETAAKWQALENCPPTEIGAGTLFYLADQASTTWRSDYRLASICSLAVLFDTDADETDLVEQAIELFDTAQPLRGSLAEKYLTGLELTVPEAAHDVLRFHPSCPFGDRNLPCLVAYVQDVLTGEPVAVHLTALSIDATVIERKIIGRSCGVIKLGGELSVPGELTIATTIEAALAAMMCGLGPAWSVLSVDGIACFPKPRYHNIKQLTVMVDCEDGIAAAQKCTQAWGSLARIVVSAHKSAELFPFDSTLPVVQ
ncbi:bifunctional DNA primase/polymerase [Bradyrhizobium sp. OAE829]|uniref:bifunctional DNA primase/polymerase n=1 Tax=Bradyrhizobium sp. OAE829 TaxID=2663807 RepID=UPI00178938BE